MRRRPQDLRGNVAFVTGGASGIGLALGTAFAFRGATVVLADVDASAGRDAATRLTSAGRAVSFVDLDVTDRGAFAAAADEVRASLGSIDYMVNSAGISMGGLTHELQGPHWDRVVELNIGGVINGVLAVYPFMVRANHGHIINIASGAGLVAPPLVLPYAASKHAVVGLSLGLRPEAALHGVRISVVCPGTVDTPILDRLPPRDLPPMSMPPVTARRYLEVLGAGAAMPAERFAERAMRQIMRNRAIIVIPLRARMMWVLGRLAPNTTLRMMGSLAAKLQRELPATSPGRPPQT